MAVEWICSWPGGAERKAVDESGANRQLDPIDRWQHNRRESHPRKLTGTARPPAKRPRRPPGAGSGFDSTLRRACGLRSSRRGPPLEIGASNDRLTRRKLAQLLKVTVTSPIVLPPRVVQSGAARCEHALRNCGGDPDLLASQSRTRTGRAIPGCGRPSVSRNRIGAAVAMTPRSIDVWPPPVASQGRPGCDRLSHEGDEWMR